MPTLEIPKTFAETLQPLPLDLMDEAGLEAVRELDEAGLEVLIGLRRTDVGEQGEVTQIANQRGVREFCPNDRETRFPGEEIAAEWHEKGRVFFQLHRKLGEAGLVGYGWTGPEKCDELPECENTFAIRLSEEVAGKRLAKPFTTAIVSGSMALGIYKIGLETWEGNIAAWKSYEKAGAVLNKSIPGHRLTIVKMTPKRVRRRQVPDSRRFMHFPQTFAA